MLRGRRKREGNGRFTGQVTDEDLACSHLVEIAHINAIPRECLSIENRRARMNKHPPILLVKILDRLRLRVELHCARDGRREFLIWEVDAGELRIEGACTEGTEKRGIGVVLVE